MKVKNFSAFFGLIKAAPLSQRDELKRQLVDQFTGGRTNSLREMTAKEYDAMCAALKEGIVVPEATKQLKSARSNVLARLTKLGVNTQSWEDVDRFCRDPRIAGKSFIELSIQELKNIHSKLISIQRKPRKEPVAKSYEDYLIVNTNRLPS